MKIVSMFVSLFVALNVCAAGHKELPAKGDLNLTVLTRRIFILYQIRMQGILQRVRMESFIW